MIHAEDVDTIRIAFDESSQTLLRIVIAAMLFGIALDTRVEDFKLAAKRPKVIALGVSLQFLVLPALTFLLTLLLGVQGSVALGMILVACCPPGNISNVVTHQARGDVALSVSMTAVANLLAILLMPLNFALWGGLHPTAGEMMRALELEASTAAHRGGDRYRDALPRVPHWRIAGRGSRTAAGIIVQWPSSHCSPSSWRSRVTGRSSWLHRRRLLAVFLHDALALGLGYPAGKASGSPTAACWRSPLRSGSATPGWGWCSCSRCSVGWAGWRSSPVGGDLGHHRGADGRPDLAPAHPARPAGRAGRRTRLTPADAPLPRGCG